MGIVYRATQLALGRPVALKLLTAQLAADDGFRERFSREWETAAAIDHPNVIPLYEAGECDGTPVHRDALRRGRRPRVHERRRADGRRRAPCAWSRRSPPRSTPPTRAGSCTATSSPRTSWSATGDHAYLSDFGLSREASQTRLTRTGLFVGSTDYAAPEQVRGEATDARTDVYALGCVLFQLLTGSVPFDRAATWRRCTPTSPSRRRSSATPGPSSAEFDAIVERAMAKEPDERSPVRGRARPRGAGRDPPVLGRAPRPRTAARPGRARGLGHRPGRPRGPDPPSAATPSGSVSGWAAGPAGRRTRRRRGSPGGSGRARRGQLAPGRRPRLPRRRPGRGPPRPEWRAGRAGRPRAGRAGRAARVAAARRATFAAPRAGESRAAPRRSAAEPRPTRRAAPPAARAAPRRVAGRAAPAPPGRTPARASPRRLPRGVAASPASRARRGRPRSPRGDALAAG